MTLVYRAIWQDDRQQLGDSVHKLFVDWVGDRSQGQIDASEPGQHHASIPGMGNLEVGVEALKDEMGQIQVYRASYIMVKPGGERWHTCVRSWSEGDGTGWCWVDNSVVGDGLSFARPLEVKAPKIARDLIDAGANPRVGDIMLGSMPREYSGSDGAADLAELITHFERTVPVIVFARDDARFSEYGGAFHYSLIAETAARDLAGIAIVVQADEPAADILTEELGREFGVYNGAVRIYIPGVDPAVDSNAFRHRFITADRHMRDRGLASALAGRIVGPASTLRRPPAGYDEIKSRLSRAKSGVTDPATASVQELEDLYNDLDSDLQESRQKVMELRQANFDLLSWQQQAEVLQKHLEYAKKQLIINGVCDDFDDDDAGNFFPKPPQTAQEAIDLARTYLSDRVEIHEDALVDAKKMDRAHEGAMWAGLAWDGFKTLYAYGTDLAGNPDDYVDLDIWCSGHRNTTGWLAAKVARGESGITKEKNGKSRIFPCSVKLSKNLEIEMYAHLKVEKRGGGNIPRIYFLYSARTKKVHVGFYGPHDLVPNTKTRKL